MSKIRENVEADLPNLVSAVRFEAVVKTTVPPVLLSLDVAATMQALCPKAFMTL